MPDDFRAFYNDILQSSVKGSLPSDILERFHVTSCLAFDDKKELYLVKSKLDGTKGVLRITKGAAASEAPAEAAILNGLHHPAIPKVIGQWSANDRSFLVREYFDGVTLHARVKGQGVLKAGQILDIAVDLCDVLSYIHGQNPPVIHRDIKPDNIVLTKEGKAKLIDFGIARKYLDGAAKDTQIIGTKPYMAPEQYGSEQTDARADIYSLGVVMIFMATGQDGKQFLNDAFPSKVLAHIIEKCIKTDRNLRFQSVKRLKSQLLRTRQKTNRKIALCAVACAGMAASFWAGYSVGSRRGFDRGVDWLLSSPAVTASPYAIEESNAPIAFGSWYIDMAVRNILNIGQDAPIYLSQARGQVGKLQIFGTFIAHPGLNTTLVKTHQGKDDVSYRTDSGFLIADRGDIGDLSDIPMFYYLRELELTSQAIADLSPLSGMKLERLNISNNFVGNLLPLKDAVTLRELDICQNPLDNLTPISRLLSLERLDISHTQVSDLKPLSGLAKLRKLELNYCDARELAPLSGLVRLQVLGMRGILPKNYGFLEKMEQLTSLDVSDSGLDAIAKLPGLAELETLRLSDNPFSSVAGLERYANLMQLCLDGTDITDIAGLRGLSRLRRLDISDTGVHNISAVADMPGLRELDISNTLVSDLTPLLGRPEPITVICAGIPAETVAQIRNAENIIIAE